ncbi:DUF2780 domain-containing protein [Ferrimonas aestuarii]|uniref:DUF2780 domain-containing protein n=1 Tax=Ferrimonas aestuarii TaxID=2569539 RepID=A0A4U1BV95_9GAMM|nr:DUF2780 domain-containing protein [Ferrimonas aestuarii]TKB58521.1 DUF2780 domain-containing protein [Ferrimonas aestuarii]
MKRFLSMLMLASALLLPSTSAMANLLETLTSQLGVSEQQAQGGLGALLATAQPNLSSENLSALGGIIPNMDGLLATGTKLLSSGESSDSGFGSMLGQVMGDSGSSLLGLNDAFSSLGLDSAMVGQFSQILLDYVNSEGGQALMQQLKGALLP